MDAYLGAAFRTPYGAFGGALRKGNVHWLQRELSSALLGKIPLGTLDRLVLASALPIDQEGSLAQPEFAHPAPLCVHQGNASALWGLALAMEALAAGQATRVAILAAAHPSSTPFFLPEARWGTRFGEVELRDPLMAVETCDATPPPKAGRGLIPLMGPEKGRHLEDDEPLPPEVAWRDGAAALLIGCSPFPDCPQVRLFLQRSPSSGPQRRGPDFPGGLGMAELVAAFHEEGGREECTLIFQTVLETWTLRLRRETP